MTQTRLSADGRFRWHDDLGVWEPIAPISAGDTTPDGRYRWDGAKWQVNLAPAEGWSRVAQDEAEGRERREAGGRLPQPPDEILCPDCRGHMIRRHDRCYGCGLSWEEAAFARQHRSQVTTALRALLGVFAVVAGVLIAGMLLFAIAASMAPNSNNK
jgi:hypothetical protein